MKLRSVNKMVIPPVRTSWRGNGKNLGPSVIFYVHSAQVLGLVLQAFLPSTSPPPIKGGGDKVSSFLEDMCKGSSPFNSRAKPLSGGGTGVPSLRLIPFMCYPLLLRVFDSATRKLRRVTINRGLNFSGSHLW